MAQEEAQRQSHKTEFAFLLGMGSAGKDVFSWEGFYPSESPQRRLYDRKARLLAISLGFAKAEEGTVNEEADWKFKLLHLLEPFYAPAVSPDWTGFVETFDEPDYWDDATCRSYLIGAYCRFGHGDRIGYLSTLKARFIAKLLHRVRGEIRPALEVSTLVGHYAPGGSRINLPSDQKTQEIVAEANKLLAEEEPNPESAIGRNRH